MANSIAPTLHQPLHSKVSNYLNDQRRTGQFCDLMLELESSTTTGTIFGHFCVVGAQSELIGGSHSLHKTLQFSISNPLKVVIRNFSCMQCLQTIVDFFYEDVVSIAKEHELHFRKLAKMLSVTELLKLYELQEDCGVNVIATEVPTAELTCRSSEATVGVVSVAGSNNETLDKQADVQLATNNIFEDQRNYFKLKNPRAAGFSNKINYCIACDFKCYRVQEMITHMNSCEASSLTCSLCEVGFVEWRVYEAHLRKHSADLKKPFFCLECDTRFMTRAALMVHHPKHSAETPHLCPHCGKGFKWKQGLSSHLLVHNKEKQMLCDVCGYSATHMKALKSHKLQHTGEFFKCTYPGCQHRANRKENLKLHIETHKQERPFVCEVCGCKFSQSKNLKRHALKHSTENTKKYKCQLCSFCSHRSDKLREHVQRVHTEKAVQLELPEVVENAFENKVEDEFNLPILEPTMSTTMNEQGQLEVEKQQAAARKRKRSDKLVTILRRPRVLAPKPTPRLPS